MNNKKLTKAELRDEISNLINTINVDFYEYERILVNNEVYRADDDTEGYERLNKSARIVTMLALQNHDHILRKLCELSRSI